MIHHPEFTPAPTTEVPGPDLFMTVIKVADWARAVTWHVDTLGLMAVLADSEHQFALRAAGMGRKAIARHAFRLGIPVRCGLPTARQRLESHAVGSSRNLANGLDVRFFEWMTWADWHKLVRDPFGKLAVRGLSST